MKHAWDHSREKTHSCSKCAKTFHNKARLKRHMMSHRNKSVTCDVCGDKFPDGRSLMNHRHSHTNVSGRQFPCRECGKTFGSRSSQQIHIRIHTGERPYGCKYCWKAFADGGTLRKHERIHTGEKPYACSVCPRAFNQRVVLREHIRSHHSAPDSQRGTSVTPYFCEVCSEMFALPTELIQHLIQHSDMNTLAKRQPPTGPRKYKRRRKLKPHELERLRAHRTKNSDMDFSEEDQMQSENQLQERYQTPPVAPTGSGIGNRQAMGNTVRRGKNTFTIESLDDRQLLHSSEDFETSVAKFDLTKGGGVRKKNAMSMSLSAAMAANSSQSRPKMIRTQKTRVAVEDGKRRTKTLITRTAPADIVATTASMVQAQTFARGSKQVRARIKNVNFHYQGERMMSPATFSDVPDQMAQDGLSVKQEPVEMTATATVLEHDGSGLSKKTYNKYSMDIVNDLEAILRSPIKQSAVPKKELNQTSPNEQNSKGGIGGGSSKSRRQISTPGKKRSQPEVTVTSTPTFSNVNLTKRQLALAAKKSAKGGGGGSGGGGGGSGGGGGGSGAVKDTNLSVRTEKDDEVITGDIDDTGAHQSNAREFKCEMCSSMFFTQEDLFAHVAIHI
uniref:C2H2-type domain-containing protein n=1 Tax=Phlebotomus papatasi TaxID=29031 RepID=A0A1B0D1D9_PHLPP